MKNQTFWICSITEFSHSQSAHKWKPSVKALLGVLCNFVTRLTEFRCGPLAFLMINGKGVTWGKSLNERLHPNLGYLHFKWHMPFENITILWHPIFMLRTDEIQRRMTPSSKELCGRGDSFSDPGWSKRLSSEGENAIKPLCLQVWKTDKTLRL